MPFIDKRMGYNLVIVFLAQSKNQGPLGGFIVSNIGKISTWCIRHILLLET
jgi:hypothetical protein